METALEVFKYEDTYAYVKLWLISMYSYVELLPVKENDPTV